MLSKHWIGPLLPLLTSMVLTCRKRLGLAPHSQRSINDETLIMDSSKG